MPPQIVTIEQSPDGNVYARDTDSGSVIAMRRTYCNPAALAQLICDVEAAGHTIDWHESTVAQPESR